MSPNGKTVSFWAEIDDLLVGRTHSPLVYYLLTHPLGLPCSNCKTNAQLFNASILHYS